MAGKFEHPRNRSGGKTTTRSDMSRSASPRSNVPHAATGQGQQTTRLNARQSAHRRSKRRSPLLPIVLIALILAVLVFGVVKLINVTTGKPALDSGEKPSSSTIEPKHDELESTEPPTETTLPEPEHVVATATIGATGDLLMHKPIITAAYTDSGYDFSFIFKYLKTYSQSVDFAVANLETTLAGSSKTYQGYPYFNCPDEIVTAAKDAGFDMLLTANNHSFDTGIDGYLRTIEVIQDAGLETLGTMASAEDPKYAIEEINGIRIGLICYTYETSDGSGSTPALNGLPMTGATYDNINCYRPDDPSSMYTEVEQYLAEMKSAGVEATVMFIHWGPQEYSLTQSSAHQAIAQKLCDLGIDVIVGGHPHVVQPMELLTSTTNPEHRTVCLYSMGNAVSNQRLGNLSSVSTAHTEDGVWFTITFCKYSDGTVYLDAVELIPTWVYLNGEYIILPLDESEEDQWGTLYNISESTVNAAVNSYNRTMELVGDGLTTSQTYLAQARESRDAAYEAAVLQPAA